MKVNRLLSLLCVVIISGCLPGQKPAEWEGTIPALKPGQSRIYFFREAGKLGRRIIPVVMLNGRRIGQSVAGSFFFVDRKPGNYEATLSTKPDEKLTLELRGNEEQYIRMVLKEGRLLFRIKLEQESAEKALREMNKLRYRKQRLQ